MMGDMAKVQMMEQCALARAKVRHGLMTFNLRRARFDWRDGNPVRTFAAERLQRIVG
jgi:hypothetical protein